MDSVTWSGDTMSPPLAAWILSPLIPRPHLLGVLVDAQHPPTRPFSLQALPH